MQQRTRRSYENAIYPDSANSLLHQIESAFEMSLPNVTTINHSQRKRQARRDLFNDRNELFRCSNQVHMQRSNGKPKRCSEVVTKSPEVGRYEHARPSESELTVGRNEGA